MTGTGLPLTSVTRENILLGARALYWSHWGRLDKPPVNFRDQHHRAAYQFLSFMELTDESIRNGSRAAGRRTHEELFGEATSGFWDAVTGHQEYMDAQKREALRRLEAGQPA